MPRDFPRAKRIGEQVQRELAELVRREVRDPRLGPVTITGVEVTRDLGYAKVYYTLLGGQGDREAAQEILSGAAPYLRHELGKRMRAHSTPELRFHYDIQMEQGAQLRALIDKAVSDDAARHVDDETE